LVKVVAPRHVWEALVIEARRLLVQGGAPQDAAIGAQRRGHPNAVRVDEVLETGHLDEFFTDVFVFIDFIDLIDLIDLIDFRQTWGEPVTHLLQPARVLAILEDDVPVTVGQGQKGLVPTQRARVARPRAQQERAQPRQKEHRGHRLVGGVFNPGDLHQRARHRRVAGGVGRRGRATGLAAEARLAGLAGLAGLAARRTGT
jgi:hypothetical protein